MMIRSRLIIGACLLVSSASWAATSVKIGGSLATELADAVKVLGTERLHSVVCLDHVTAKPRTCVTSLSNGRRETLRGPAAERLYDALVNAGAYVSAEPEAAVVSVTDLSLVAETVSFQDLARR